MQNCEVSRSVLDVHEAGTIAETQRRRERGNALQDEEFDFTFAHILAEVLGAPQLNESPDRR